MSVITLGHSENGVHECASWEKCCAKPYSKREKTLIASWNCTKKTPTKRARSPDPAQTSGFTH